jgi:hypothetical protein
MTLAYAFAWLASIAATVYLMIRRSAPVLDAADDAIDAANDTIDRQRTHIANLTDYAARAEMERDEALAALNARIARRSEASKRAAETRRARAVLIAPVRTFTAEETATFEAGSSIFVDTADVQRDLGAAVLASDAEGAE